MVGKVKVFTDKNLHPKLNKYKQLMIDINSICLQQCYFWKASLSKGMGKWLKKKKEEGYNGLKKLSLLYDQKYVR